jgi:hypothetical protein
MMRRTGLSRRTPLAQGTARLSRKSRLRRVPLMATPSMTGRHRKAPKDTGPSAKVRLLVLSRDRLQCVRCGRPAGPGRGPYSLQHRKARGTGGDSSPPNLILLCGTATSPDCHRLCEDRDEECHAQGYWLASWEDPATTPVMYFEESGSGVSAWLLDDGTLAFEPPGAAA